MDENEKKKIQNLKRYLIKDHIIPFMKLIIGKNTKVDLENQLFYHFLVV